MKESKSGGRRGSGRDVLVQEVLGEDSAKERKRNDEKFIRFEVLPLHQGKTCRTGQRTQPKEAKEMPGATVV